MKEEREIETKLKREGVEDSYGWLEEDEEQGGVDVLGFTKIEERETERMGGRKVDTTCDMYMSNK